MASYEIEGTMYSKKEKQVITDKFTKQEFVIVTSEAYPQYVALQCVNDKCELLKGIGKDTAVKVSFNLSGKPFKNKQGEEVVMTNLNAYKIEKVGTTQTQSTPPKTQAAPPPTVDSEVDDLPF